MLITINLKPDNLLLNRDPWPQGLNPKCLNSENWPPVGEQSGQWTLN